MSDFRKISSSLPVGKQSEDKSTNKPDGPEPHNGLLYCYEGTNITEENVVNHYRTQLIDALIESYGPRGFPSFLYTVKLGQNPRPVMIPRGLPA